MKTDFITESFRSVYRSRVAEATKASGSSDAVDELILELSSDDEATRGQAAEILVVMPETSAIRSAIRHAIRKAFTDEKVDHIRFLLAEKLSDYVRDEEDLDSFNDLCTNLLQEGRRAIVLRSMHGLVNATPELLLDAQRLLKELQGKRPEFRRDIEDSLDRIEKRISKEVSLTDRLKQIIEQLGKSQTNVAICAPDKRGRQVILIGIQDDLNYRFTWNALPPRTLTLAVRSEQAERDGQAFLVEGVIDIQNHNAPFSENLVLRAEEPGDVCEATIEIASGVSFKPDEIKDVHFRRVDGRN